VPKIKQRAFARFLNIKKRR